MIGHLVIMHGAHSGNPQSFKEVLLFSISKELCSPEVSTALVTFPTHDNTYSRIGPHIMALTIEEPCLF